MHVFFYWQRKKLNRRQKGKLSKLSEGVNWVNYEPHPFFVLSRWEVILVGSVSTLLAAVSVSFSVVCITQKPLFRDISRFHWDFPRKRFVPLCLLLSNMIWTIVTGSMSNLTRNFQICLSSTDQGGGGVQPCCSWNISHEALPALTKVALLSAGRTLQKNRMNRFSKKGSSSSRYRAVPRWEPSTRLLRSEPSIVQHHAVCLDLQCGNYSYKAESSVMR